MKKWVVLFNSENVHLLKDVGMIAYTMYRKYGMEASLATYKNGEYTYNEDEVSGLKLEFIKKRSGFILDACVWLWKHAKEIDVLQLFHLKRSTMLFTQIYKFRNKKGKVYIKLDGNIEQSLIDRLNKKIYWRYSLKNTVCQVELITTENEMYVEEARNALNHSIAHIPNGCYIKSQKEYDKENIIFHMSRLGTYQKNTEFLVEGFTKMLSSISNWKLFLAGDMTPEFTQWYAEWMKNHTECEGKIIYLGFLSNRDRVEEIYKKSKIFALTSRWEGFCISVVEALCIGGCDIVTSDIEAESELVENHENMFSYQQGNMDEFVSLLELRCAVLENIEQDYFVRNRIQLRQELAWEGSCEKIYNMLDL